MAEAASLSIRANPSELADGTRCGPVAQLAKEAAGLALVCPLWEDSWGGRGPCGVEASSKGGEGVAAGGLLDWGLGTGSRSSGNESMVWPLLQAGPS